MIFYTFFNRPCFFYSRLIKFLQVLAFSRRNSDLLEFLDYFLQFKRCQLFYMLKFLTVCKSVERLTRKISGLHTQKISGFNLKNCKTSCMNDRDDLFFAVGSRDATTPWIFFSQCPDIKIFILKLCQFPLQKVPLGH